VSFKRDLAARNLIHQTDVLHARSSFATALAARIRTFVDMPHSAYSSIVDMPHSAYLNIVDMPHSVYPNIVDGPPGGESIEDVS
jgi:hypothetical protein